MPWPLIAVVLAWVCAMLLVVVLCQCATIRDQQMKIAIRDAQIARLEGLVRFAGGTMRTLVEAHCSCANDEL